MTCDCAKKMREEAEQVVLALVRQAHTSESAPLELALARIRALPLPECPHDPDAIRAAVLAEAVAVVQDECIPPSLPGDAYTDVGSWERQMRYEAACKAVSRIRALAPPGYVAVKKHERVVDRAALDVVVTYLDTGKYDSDELDAAAASLRAALETTDAE